MTTDDCLKAARLVREISAALSRLRGGIALTSANRLIDKLDLIARSVGVARVQASALALEAEVFDPSDAEPPTGPQARSLPWVEALSKRPAKKRSLSPDQWDDLQTEVEVIGSHLYDLASIYADHPKLAARWDQAAVMIADVWASVIESGEVPSEPRPKPSYPSYRPPTKDPNVFTPHGRRRRSVR